jgi:hypothetical protein
MNISLYAQMSEFAPVSTAKKAGEDAGEGIGEKTHEEESEHVRLFEQCAPDGVSGRGDAAQYANLTADVPDLQIGGALAGGNLTDGYKLHDVALFDSGRSDINPLTKGVTEVAAIAQSSVVPNLDLDYSTDVAATTTAQHGAAEPSARGQATA